MRLLLITYVVFFLPYMRIVMATEVSLSKPNCPEKCGDITIPFPFGVGPECSANSWFTVICLNGTNPFLISLNLEVAVITLSNEIRVKHPISPIKCSNEQRTEILGRSLLGSPFTFSSTDNSLVVLGCKSAVWLQNSKTRTVGGCMAICDAASTDTSCNGVNCCHTKIPPTSQQLKYTYRSIEPSNGTSFCGYAFLVETQWFRDNYEIYKELQKDLLIPVDKDYGHVPLLLHWEFNNSDISPHAHYFHDLSFGFNCGRAGLQSSAGRLHCTFGFVGNPYLKDGCQDVDECSEPEKYCPKGICTNTYGSYTCDNSQLQHYSSGSRAKIAYICICSALGAALLLIAFWRLSKVINKRIETIRKRKFFKLNGGLMLEEKLSEIDNGINKIKMFGSEELAQATDHYNENRILGRGGQGTVYKGMLTDGRIVAVKKSNKVQRTPDIEEFINEVVILSQIRHRNVVKLLGCCLENETPLLVYEYIQNGTLFQHIHGDEEFPLSWEMRVRIATQVAGALSYLHSTAAMPIFHRDIKSTNILLDDKYRAKISDFGTSRAVAIDQTHLTTRVLGTFGYLDPEYFRSSQFTEKSDVYSFGVVTVELLTGEKAVSSVHPQEVRSLATHFLDSLEEDKLFDVVDRRVLKEGAVDEIVAIAQLARRCLDMNGRRRPTMKEVSMELERIQMLNEGSILQHNIKKDPLFDVCEDSDNALTTSGGICLNTITDYSKQLEQLNFDEPSRIELDMW